MTDHPNNLVVPPWLRIIALYGASAYLHDLNAMNGKGKGVPGGLSGAIDMAGLMHSEIVHQVIDIANSDPVQAEYLVALFSKSENLGVRQVGSRLRTRLQENNAE